jgi:predicted phosphoribosyltransferase
LDVVVVRKLGVPGQEELAFGAVTGDGHRVLNDDVVSAAHLSAETITGVTRREEERAVARTRRYRGTVPARSWQGRPVVVVDDGVATGATLRAALDVVVAGGPARLVVAVPVGPPGLKERLGRACDDVVVLEQPVDFLAVGQVYRHFDEVDDDEVARCLERAAG